MDESWTPADPAEQLLAPLTAQARRTRRRWVGRAAFASGGLLSATVAGALYVVDQLTRASSVSTFSEYTFTPFELGVPSEDIAIPAEDGEPLSGWWLPRPESDRVIVICYGYRRCKSDMLGVGTAVWRRGYNVLLFDYHGHGDHAGTRVTLGYREVQDALAAAHFALERLPGARLGILGFSMGGAVAIMAAAREPRIAAVIADSPFAAQRNPISRRLRRRLRLRWSGTPVLFVVDHLLHWLLGYRFRDVEPLREIPSLAPRPILLIHGTEDSLVDAHDSELLYEAAGQPKEIWLLPGVEHCGAYFVDRPAYLERICAFFDRSLGAEQPARGRTWESPAFIPGRFGKETPA